LIVLKWKGW